MVGGHAVYSSRRLCLTLCRRRPWRRRSWRRTSSRSSATASARCARPTRAQQLGQLLQFLAAAHLVGQRQQFGPLGCLPPFVAALNPGNPIVAGLNRAGPPNRCLASGGHLALRLAHRCAARAAPAPGAVPCEGAARSRVCVVAHTPPLSLTILYKFIANL